MLVSLHAGCKLTQHEATEAADQLCLGGQKITASNGESTWLLDSSFAY